MCASSARSAQISVEYMRGLRQEREESERRGRKSRNVAKELREQLEAAAKREAALVKKNEVLASELEVERMEGTWFQGSAKERKLVSDTHRIAMDDFQRSNDYQAVCAARTMTMASGIIVESVRACRRRRRDTGRFGDEDFAWLFEEIPEPEEDATDDPDDGPAASF